MNYFSEFFVDQARQSRHAFSSRCWRREEEMIKYSSNPECREEEELHLIYNHDVTFTGRHQLASYNTQMYFF